MTKEPNITVRRAVKTDIDALTGILIQSWKNAFSEIITVQTLTQYTDFDRCRVILTKAMESGEGSFLIASLDGKPCGELFWCPGKELPDAAEIAAVHSLPFCWGSGIGQAMIERAMLEIAQGGFLHTYLWVFEENLRARQFYKKCGFAPDGARRTSEYDNATEVRYVT